MSAEVVGCELNVAVLDIIDDRLGDVHDALGRVGIRMVDSSNGQ